MIRQDTAAAAASRSSRAKSLKLWGFHCRAWLRVEIPGVSQVEKREQHPHVSLFRVCCIVIALDERHLSAVLSLCVFFYYEFPVGVGESNERDPSAPTQTATPRVDLESHRTSARLITDYRGYTEARYLSSFVLECSLRGAGSSCVHVLLNPSGGVGTVWVWYGMVRGKVLYVDTTVRLRCR